MFDPVRVQRRPTGDVVWLKRTDVESAVPEIEGQEPAGVEVCDWLRYGSTMSMRLADWLDSRVTRHVRLPGWLAYGRPLLYGRVAADRVGAGLRLLSRGRVVVTDRLHGHILSLLLGIPHVLMENTYGKLGRFYETWTRGSPLAHFADSPAEALAIARSLAGGLADLRTE
jgi:pyruvyl transferase EpsO